MKFNDYDEAQDITQDVFIIVLEALKSFRQESKFSTWLYSITTNRCRRTLSSRRRAGPFEPLDDTSLADGSNPVAARAVREALRLIPGKLRIPVVLHCIFGYTYEEAAAIMKIPAGTVKTRVHRGKRALRRILEDRP